MSKSKTKQIWGSIDPNVLAEAYRSSVNRYPNLHHPAVSQGTANNNTIQSDFLAWSCGIRDCLSNPSIKQYLTNTMTGMNTSTQQSTGSSDFTPINLGQQKRKGSNQQQQGYQNTQSGSGSQTGNVPNNVRMALQQVYSTLRGGGRSFRATA